MLVWLCPIIVNWAKLIGLTFCVATYTTPTTIIEYIKKKKLSEKILTFFILENVQISTERSAKYDLNSKMTAEKKVNS